VNAIGVFKLVFATCIAISSIHACAIVVDTDLDAPATLVNGAPVCAVRIGTEMRCTLRAAIQVANFNAGSTVVELQRGRTYTLSLGRDSSAVEGQAGAPTIGPGTFATVDVTVRAVGDGQALATITKNDAFDDSLFHVIGPGGVLTLDGIELRGNVALPAPANGGAIRCDHAGSISSLNSSFVGNSAIAGGGALFLDDCGASLERTGFVANVSGVRGGAVAMQGGFVVARDASFEGNVSGEGAAIDMRSQTADFGFVAVNVTFHDNTADASILHAQNSLSVLHSVTSSEDAAPVFLDQAGGVVQITNTVIADSPGADSIRLDGAAVFHSLGHNRLQQVDPPDAAVGLLDTDMLNFADARVSIQTAALWPGVVAIPIAGSPLIGQGGGEFVGSDGSTTPLCADLDANLVSRVAMHRCDIGAANFVDPVFTDSFELLQPGKAGLRARGIRFSR
jgi:hypothetical protein